MTSQNKPKVTDFYWEIEANDEIVNVTDEQMEKILKAEERGVKLVKIGSHVINLSFVKGMKKIYKQDDFLDWSKLPEHQEKVVSDAQASKNIEEMKKKIRQMLKEKNKEYFPKKTEPFVQDEKKREAIDQVWEHLKSVLTTLEFPIKDDSWKLDRSITSHKEGSESHSVAYYTKAIDLGVDDDHHFWGEAGYVFCPVCKKELRKEIRIFNDFDCEVVVKKM